MGLGLAGSLVGRVGGGSPGPAVPVVVGVNYGLIDIGGGGKRLVVEVDDSTTCTGIAAAAVAFSSFAIDDATHVSGIPGAYAARTDGSISTGPVTLTSAGANFPPDVVGGTVRISGAATPANNGIFTITARPTSTTIEYTNPSAAADANNGSLVYSLAGVVDLVVTNAAGDSTTGTDLVEYWSPLQITNVKRYFDSRKDVTQSGGAISAWKDQVSGTSYATQSTGGNKPTLVAAVFDAEPSVRTTATKYFNGANETFANGYSVSWVGAWTSNKTTAASTGVAAPLTVAAESNGFMGYGASGGSLCAYGWVDFVGNNNITTRGSGLNDGTARLCTWTIDAPGGSGTSATAKAYVGTTMQGASASVTYYANNGYTGICRSWDATDCFIGDFGAIVTVTGVMSGGDMTKLHEWSQQSFGAAA